MGKQPLMARGGTRCKVKMRQQPLAAVSRGSLGRTRRSRRCAGGMCPGCGRRCRGAGWTRRGAGRSWWRGSRARSGVTARRRGTALMTPRRQMVRWWEGSLRRRSGLAHKPSSMKAIRRNRSALGGRMMNTCRGTKKR